MIADLHTYTYRQLSIAFRKTGTGKPLIMLHGWGTSGRVLLPMAEMLAGFRTCYILDLPGFGDTPAPDRPWNIDDYADMVQQFIKDIFDEPADLFAHSFGGRITLKLCARPEGKQLINKVLITGGAGMKPKRGLSFYLKKYTARLLKASLFILPRSMKSRALARLRNSSLWEMLGSSDYVQLNGVMRQIFVKSVTEFLEPCLPLIQHDVLLLWGRDDGAAPLYQAERMEKGISRAALVVIDNAGHYAFLDRPNHFASIAKAFLKD